MGKSKSAKPKKSDICGVIMPISSIDGCSEEHWLDVREIIFESIENVGFTPNLVSSADDVGIIQKRIIHNIYDNPIVVCDVSGKNPNVMFELGIRLAFDKPTIIIKDDKTGYSFDTAPIEHLEYPRDLRYAQINTFKEELSEKIISTLEKSKSDPNYTTFLKHFGTFTIAKLETKEVSTNEFIIDEIKSIKEFLFSNRNKPVPRFMETRKPVICIKSIKTEILEEIKKSLSANKVIIDFAVRRTGNNHYHIEVLPEGSEFLNIALEIARKFHPQARILN